MIVSCSSNIFGVNGNIFVYINQRSTSLKSVTMSSLIIVHSAQRTWPYLYVFICHSFCHSFWLKGFSCVCLFPRSCFSSPVFLQNSCVKNVPGSTSTLSGWPWRKSPSSRCSSAGGSTRGSRSRTGEFSFMSVNWLVLSVRVNDPSPKELDLTNDALVVGGERERESWQRKHSHNIS